MNFADANYIYNNKGCCQSVSCGHKENTNGIPMPPCSAQECITSCAADSEQECPCCKAKDCRFIGMPEERLYRTCCDENGICCKYPCCCRDSFWPEFTHPRWLCCKDLYRLDASDDPDTATA